MVWVLLATSIARFPNTGAGGKRNPKLLVTIEHLSREIGSLLCLLDNAVSPTSVSTPGRYCQNHRITTLKDTVSTLEETDRITSASTLEDIVRITSASTLEDTVRITSVSSLEDTLLSVLDIITSGIHSKNGSMYFILKVCSV